MQAIVLQSLSRCLPTTSFPKGHWPHLSSLKLADPAFNISKPIDILLGVSAYRGILKQGLILGPKGTPSAQETIFGWVLFGNVNGNRSTTESVTTLHVSTAYPSCEETLQKLALQHYNQHLRHEENGRFIVNLHYKPQKSTWGESRPLALRRFLSPKRRLRRSEQFEDYANVVNEYISSGHAERVPDNDLNKPSSDIFYLAHHAVYKDSTTTPLRVVFDGSMKTTSGVSLNDQLLVGPTVYSPLNDVLIFQSMIIE
jgi:hypothetical protein